MRKTLCVVALLIGCGGKHSSNPPPENDERVVDGNDGGLGGSDGGPDGGVPRDGLDGGRDGGLDGGQDDGLAGYSTRMTLTPNPHGAAGGGTQEALICCTTATVINCQTPGGEGVFSPARRLAVLEPGTGQVSAKIYSDANCRALDRTLSDIFDFPSSSLWAVNIDFTPPLPLGRHVSIKWTAGPCEETPCIDYVIGSIPGGCWDDYVPPTGAGGRCER
jgi:hypothetical protein